VIYHGENFGGSVIYSAKEKTKRNEKKKCPIAVFQDRAARGVLHAYYIFLELKGAVVQTEKPKPHKEQIYNRSIDREYSERLKITAAQPHDEHETKRARHPKREEAQKNFIQREHSPSPAGKK